MTDFSGKPKQVKRPAQEIVHPLYPEMSKGERVAKFRYTGDASYLLPEEAREMGLGYEMMQEVPGATAEDIEYARQHGFNPDEDFDAYKTR